MSVDGPGILASDLGHDVYHEIMNLYDSGTSIEEIRKRVGNHELELEDDMDKEIYLAASAKAFWDIGHLDGLRLADLSQLVKSGTSLSLWRQAGGTSLAGARKAALGRLLQQIATPRKAPRTRRRPRQIKNKLFVLGDCLQLTVNGKCYRTVVCEIREELGWCGYSVLLMSPDTGSTAKEYAASSYYGRLIPTYEGPVRGPNMTFLAHRDLVRDGNPFQIEGRVPLDPTKYESGTFGVIRSVSELATGFDGIGGRPEAPGLFGDVLLPLRELLLEP